jgi:hypothetical protein
VTADRTPSARGHRYLQEATRRGASRTFTEHHWHPHGCFSQRVIVHRARCAELLSPGSVSISHPLSTPHRARLEPDSMRLCHPSSCVLPSLFWSHLGQRAHSQVGAPGLPGHSLSRAPIDGTLLDCNIDTPITSRSTDGVVIECAICAPSELRVSLESA